MYDILIILQIISAFITFCLVIAAFCSICQTRKIIQQTKNIAETQRKDNFLPQLFIYSIYIHNNLLSISVGNIGKGMATYKGFYIPQANIQGGDHGENIVVETNTDMLKGISLHILKDNKIAKDYHQKELMLFFSDIFGRKITLSCFLFYDEENNNLYTKKSTVKMIITE